MRRAGFPAVAAVLAGTVWWPAFDLAQAAPPCTKAATHAARGADAPYPAALAGPHGKGLAGRGLKRDRLIVEDDD